MEGMLTIAGYEVTELIYSGVRSLIYRGVRLADQRPVVLKTLTASRPTVGAIATLKHEYETLSRLDFSGVIKPVEWQAQAAVPILVLEDTQSQSLRDFIGHQGALPLTQFLTIAVQLAQILHQLHGAQLIHRDIKPSNILINPKTGEIQLIDFGLATQLAPTRSAMLSIVGTYAYMSPEQTGRMNRTVDHRTDLYSLGVTFYEMLCGQLPFQAEDAMAWVHCHIAKAPPLLKSQNPEIPTVLSQIVGKLLAKMAEDRYQKAQGLLADLETCLDQLDGHGTISTFTIGQRDRSGQFRLPQKLYGREQEIATLLTTFERTRQGTPELILVSGYSGIGKSALVHEVHKPIVGRRGYFIAGKFDQFRRNVPYESVMQAFQDLMRQLLSESNTKLQHWRQQLQDSLGNNAQVLIDVIPELEFILGPQPPLPEVSPAEAQVRFNQTFLKLVGVFAQPEHPLVIFLDDLQWVDQGSLDLIQQLLTQTATGQLLIIGAYRDNEVEQDHPLFLALEQLRHTQIPISTIALQPLQQRHVHQLVADTLSTQIDLVQPLGDLLFTKTLGNAFFTRMLFKSLYSQGQLTFDFDEAVWLWDMAALETISLTDNVVELMTSRIHHLPEATQQLLTLAACIGDQFDLSVLSVVSEQAFAAVAQGLWPALEGGLIVPLDDDYRIPMLLASETLVSGVIEKIRYRFVHDRIQEAAYGLLDVDQRQQTHWQIGQLLLQGCRDDALDDHVFEIVNHLNRGRQEVASEPYLRARLNWQAGRKAKGSSAYEAALNYFSTGLDLLTDAAWQVNYDLAFSLHRDGSECEYLCGHFDRAEELFASTLAHAQSVLDQAEIHIIRIVLYDNQGKFVENLTVGSEALRSLGVHWPTAPDEILPVLAAEQETYQHHLQNHQIPQLLDQPEMTDPTARACMQLLVNMTGPAYFTDPNLVTLVTLKMANLSMQYGSSKWASQGYTFWGVMLAAAFRDYATAYQFGQVALQLNERYNRHNEVKVLNSYCGHILPWHSHFHNGIELLRRAYRVGSETGDVFTGYALTHLGVQLLLVGSELNEMGREIGRYLTYLRKTQNVIMSRQLQIYLFAAAALQTGQFLTEATGLEDFDEADCLALFQANRYGPGLVSHSAFKAMSCFIYGQYAEALQLCQESEQNIAFAASIPTEAEHYVFYALTLAQLYETAEPDVQESYQATMAVCLEKLQGWAQNCAANYQHRASLVAAERARVLGHLDEAIDSYDLAIASAQTHGFVQYEALANERTAQFWLTRGKDNIARGYLQAAHYAYQRWGAQAKVNALEQRYPQLLITNLPPPVAVVDESPSLTSNSVSSSSDSGSLDLSTVMKASQAIASEIRLESLLQTLMHIVLENAGAQTGVLALMQGNDWVIKAIGHADGSVTVPPVGEASAVRTGSLPLSVMNYVARTQAPLLTTSDEFPEALLQDDYIREYQPKSILCAPIINQGQLLGLLYLENSLTFGAFTDKRLETLKILSSQIAISLTNARLYENLQDLNTDLQQEVTRRRATEATLRESEQRLVQLLEGIPVGVFVMDAQGRPYYANQAAQNILGKGIAPDVAVPELSEVYQVYRADSSVLYPSEQLPILRALRGEQVTVDDMEIHQDVQIVPLEVSATPVFSEQGEITYAIAAFQDITQRRQAENQQAQFTHTLTAKNEALQQARDALAEANRTLEQRVQARTQELSQTLDLLKATQAELVIENELLRSADQPSQFDYQVGGCLTMGAPTYVVRQADRQLYQALRRGQYCYIFNARQMGKSSLRVQMMNRLQPEGIACASIDLSAIGNRQTTVEQWYAGLMYLIASQLGLIGQVNIRQWWQENSFLSPLHRLGEFVHQVVLERVSSDIIIFIDEVDSVLSLDFDADDFFIWLRNCFNLRAEDARYRRLTFVLLGVATPSQLIQDAHRTPFNIGQAIELNGFQLHEAQPLLRGLSAQVAQPQSVLAQILDWTGGQPFLSQKICRLIQDLEIAIAEGEEVAQVDTLVRSHLICHWEAKDDPEHLRTVRNRLLIAPARAKSMLMIYQQLLSSAQILADDSPEHTELRLSGLVVKRGGYLAIANRLYTEVFNRDWVAQTLAHL